MADLFAAFPMVGADEAFLQCIMTPPCSPPNSPPRSGRCSPSFDQSVPRSPGSPWMASAMPQHTLNTLPVHLNKLYSQEQEMPQIVGGFSDVFSDMGMSDLNSAYATARPLSPPAELLDMPMLSSAMSTPAASPLCSPEHQHNFFEPSLEHLTPEDVDLLSMVSPDCTPACSEAGDNDNTHHLLPELMPLTMSSMSSMSFSHPPPPPHLLSMCHSPSSSISSAASFVPHVTKPSKRGRKNKAPAKVPSIGAATDRAGRAQTKRIANRSPSSKRDNHNNSERNRRAELKKSFDRLRVQIPELEGSNKWHTGQILKAAINFINQLRQEELDLIDAKKRITANMH